MLTKAQSVLCKLRNGLQNIETNLAFALGIHKPPPYDFSIAAASPDTVLSQKPTPKVSLKEMLDTSILWAVPKARRSLEKRMCRKYGIPDKVWKLFVPRKDLIICNTCGHYHNKKQLCGHCYLKIKEQTTQMQEKIVAELGLEPIDKEVVLLYKGEKENASDDFNKTHRIIELEGERPPWFSKNLLQKTTQRPSDATDVKPTDLG